MLFKVVKIILNLFAVIILCVFVFIVVNPAHNSDIKSTSQKDIPKILPYSLSNKDIIYNTKGNSDVLAEEILNRAKAMTEVKWIPDHNLSDKNCTYTFIKGKTYKGVPYSMGSYQVSSPNNFLAKINNSRIIYGNDCSGLVSTAWGIKRQTTLSLYNDIKNGNKIGNKTVCQISWDDLRPTDALLLDDGKGKGHIMLYINCDTKNGDNLNVYEQNISTVEPFEPIPVARRDIRSKKKLIKKGYIPIRLM